MRDLSVFRKFMTPWDHPINNGVIAKDNAQLNLRTN